MSDKNDFKTLSSKSVEDFVDLVVPQALPFLGDVIIKPSEASTARYDADALDVICGIDALVYEEGKGVYGMASRVRYCNSPFDSFTLRYRRGNGSYETEYNKLIDAMALGNLYPKKTIQAFVSADRKVLYSLAIVYTASLVHYVQRHYGQWLDVVGRNPRTLALNPNPSPSFSEYGERFGLCLRRNNNDGSEFFCITWKGLETYGAHKLQIWRNPECYVTDTKDKSQVKQVDVLDNVRPTLAVDELWDRYKPDREVSKKIKKYLTPSSD